jgi:hypothetical protein
MEEEFKELERKSAPRWVLGVLALVVAGAAVGAYLWFAPGRSGALAPPVQIQGVPIDISQPRNGSVLPAPPEMFAWESVADRDHYLFTLQLEGAPAALLERGIKSSTFRPTKEELLRLGPGSYVWIVRARTKDGTVLGTGHGRFRIR